MTTVDDLNWVTPLIDAEYRKVLNRAIDLIEQYEPNALSWLTVIPLSVVRKTYYWAAYRPESKSIVIAKDAFESATGLAASLIHETVHVQQDVDKSVPLPSLQSEVEASTAEIEFYIRIPWQLRHMTVQDAECQWKARALKDGSLEAKIKGIYTPIWRKQS